jgi:hypothetical protein
MEWDVKNWDRESTKTSQTHELIDVLDFHEFKNDSWNVINNNNHCLLFFNNFVSSKVC